MCQESSEILNHYLENLLKVHSFTVHLPQHRFTIRLFCTWKKHYPHQMFASAQSQNRSWSSELIPSYPADLLRAHSCLKGLCISCSPPLLACGGPDLQAGGVSAAPRPSWQSWRLPHTDGPRKQRERCCCHCSAQSCKRKASGWKGCLCGCQSLNTGSPLPHYRKEKQKLLVWVSHKCSLTISFWSVL